MSNIWYGNLLLLFLYSNVRHILFRAEGTHTSRKSTYEQKEHIRAERACMSRRSTYEQKEHIRAEGARISRSAYEQKEYI